MKALLLLGGLSSRMHAPKHMLEIPSSSKPLFLHAYDILSKVFDPDAIYISLRPSQEPGIRKHLPAHFRSANLLFDDDDNSSLGPASGLISILQQTVDGSLDNDWLVLAVDFPFLSRDSIEYLIS